MGKKKNKEKSKADKKVATLGDEKLYHDIEAEKKKKLEKKKYEKLLGEQDIEMIKLQEWVKANKLKVVVIFEGRDAAGKGGVIKTI
ncbi:MAG: hypothetical protein HZB98_14945 [Bacteroidia bacterium]|nr:hypothetical protein [Bacteroidia bacterium]